MLDPNPSFAQGFARSASESAYPEDWRDLDGVWCPYLGHTGLNLHDLSGHGHHFVRDGTDDLWEKQAGDDGWSNNFAGGTSIWDAVTNWATTGDGVSCTVTAWAYPKADVNVDARYFSQASGAAANAHYLMLGNSGHDNVRCRVKIEGSTTTVVGTTEILIGQWHFAAVRCSRTATGIAVELFMGHEGDAGLTAEGNDTQGGTMSVDPSIAVSIGGNPGSTNTLIDGNLDDIRLYGAALTDDHLNRIFRRGRAAMFQLRPDLIGAVPGTGQTVAVPAVSATASIVAPDQVNRTISVGAISATSAVVAPGVAFDQFVALEAATQATAAIVAPDQVNRTTAVPAITATSAVVAPDQVNQTVAVPAITATSAVVAPAVAGAQEVAVPAISATASIVAPDQVNRAIDVAAITATTAVVTPGIAQGQTVAVPAITATTAVVAPDQVNQAVPVPATAATTSVVAPTIPQTVAVPAITATTAVVAPGVAQGQTVAVPAVSASTAVVAPDQVNRAIDVAAITATTAVVVPGVSQAGAQNVAVPSISATAAIVAPDQVNRTTDVPAITATSAVVAPDVAADQFVAVPAITATTAVVAPQLPGELNQDVTVPVISATTAGALIQQVVALELCQESLYLVDINLNGQTLKEARFPVVELNTTTTLDETHHIVLVDATSGVVTIDLPAAASYAGKVYSVKKLDGSANNVTLDGNSSETIDGATTKALTSQYESVTVVCDGTEWHVIA